MPHCFRLAHRPSRDYPAAWCLAALVAVACNQDNPVAPDLGTSVSAADSSGSTPNDTGIVVVTDSIGDGTDSTLAAAETGTTIFPGRISRPRSTVIPAARHFNSKDALGALPDAPNLPDPSLERWPLQIFHRQAHQHPDPPA
jgi:hypothetical protein